METEEEIINNEVFTESAAEEKLKYTVETEGVDSDIFRKGSD